MDKQKIDRKFYPLQHEEWIRACRELSKGARDVLYYLRTLDPYGNGIDVNASAIARDLGVNRSTVSRALMELKKEGWLEELEIISAHVRLSAKGFHFERECCKNATRDAKTQQDVQNCNDQCENATTSAKMQQAEQLEPPPCTQQANSPSPKNIKTNKNFDQTFSEATEREKNLNFWNKMGIEEKNQVIKAAHESFLPKLPQQPALIIKWIQCNCIEIAASCGIDKNSEISLGVEILYQAQEWEIEPGIPYPNFKEERVQYWIAKGEPLETATAKAGSELRNPLTAKDLWEGFLRKCDRIADEAIKAKNMGVSTPYLPPSFTEKPAITKESVMQKLTDVSPQVLVGASTKEQLNIPESKQEEYKPTIDQLQKIFDNPIGKNFVKEQIEANPDWGYEIVDGRVIEIDS